MGAQSLAATGNRQQATGNRQQATGNRQQATGNRQRDNNRHHLALTFYFLAVVIVLMAMVKPAHASGTVSKPSGTNYVYVDPNTGSTGGDGTQPTIQQVIAETLVCNGRYTDVNAMSPCLIAATGYAYQSGWYSIVAWAGWWALHLSATSPNSIALGAVFGGVAACPANSADTTTTCTCNDPYVPDSTQTSCVQEQYTISIQPAPANGGAYTILPSATLPLTAIVTDQNGVVQQGIQVTLTANVQDGTGGHIHNGNRSKGFISWCGSMPTPWTCTLTTSYNGQAPFIFVSTPVSGVHTITATCSGCNNTANATVNVKVPDLIPIPASPYYALQDSAGNVIGAIKNQHSDNHYLTAAAVAKLTKFAKNYQTKVLPYAKLYLNDASLVWGGLFDVDKTKPWTSPHIGHDRGVSVDIRAENIGGQYEGAVPIAYFDDTIKAAARAGARAALHCQGSTVTAVCLGIPYNRHFHVDF